MQINWKFKGMSIIPNCILPTLLNVRGSEQIICCKRDRILFPLFFFFTNQDLHEQIWHFPSNNRNGTMTHNKPNQDNWMHCICQYSSLPHPWLKKERKIWTAICQVFYGPKSRNACVIIQWYVLFPSKFNIPKMEPLGFQLICLCTCLTVSVNSVSQPRWSFSSCNNTRAAYIISYLI